MAKFSTMEVSFCSDFGIGIFVCPEIRKDRTDASMTHAATINLKDFKVSYVEIIYKVNYPPPKNQISKALFSLIFRGT